jgi:hypothetical protein
VWGAEVLFRSGPANCTSIMTAIISFPDRLNFCAINCALCRFHACEFANFSFFAKSATSSFAQELKPVSERPAKLNALEGNESDLRTSLSGPLHGDYRYKDKLADYSRRPLSSA